MKNIFIYLFNKDFFNRQTSSNSALKCRPANVKFSCPFIKPFSLTTKGNELFGSINSNASCFRKKFIFRPFIFESKNYNRHWNSIDSAPFYEMLNLPIKFYKMISTVVKHLFSSSSPFAVFFRIITIVINSFYCSVRFSKLLNMNFIRSSHVFLKFTKRSPQVFYPSSSIVFIRMMIRIITSSLHSIINLMKSLIARPKSSSHIFYLLRESAGRLASILHFIRKADNSRILAQNMI